MESIGNKASEQLEQRLANLYYDTNVLHDAYAKFYIEEWQRLTNDLPPLAEIDAEKLIDTEFEKHKQLLRDIREQIQLELDSSLKSWRKANAAQLGKLEQEVATLERIHYEESWLNKIKSKIGVIKGISELRELHSFQYPAIADEQFKKMCFDYDKLRNEYIMYINPTVYINPTEEELRNFKGTHNEIKARMESYLAQHPAADSKTKEIAKELINGIEGDIKELDRELKQVAEAAKIDNNLMNPMQQLQFNKYMFYQSSFLRFNSNPNITGATHSK